VTAGTDIFLPILPAFSLFCELLLLFHKGT
jgi:hypothetical protein